MFAASKAASREMEKISFGPSKDIPGYVAGPKGAPAVLVIHSGVVGCDGRDPGARTQ
jgi:hypothetical protein